MFNRLLYAFYKCFDGSIVRRCFTLVINTIQSLRVTVCQEQLELLPQRAIWWPARNALLVADVHLGKVNHFRKSGMPVPARASNKNWETLVELVMLYRPERLICIGDLFHSSYNYDWESIRSFTSQFSTLQFELVSGNHDILSEHLYQQSSIVVHCEHLLMDPFKLIHIPPDEPVTESTEYILSGHIHPGVQLVGRGRQSITLPCFHFGESQGLLPAFGAFTGLARIVPKKSDRIFVIAENKVMTMT